MTFSRRRFVGLAGGSVAATLLAACSGGQQQETKDSANKDESTDAAATKSATTKAAIDYMALVNKQHKLPDGWEDALDLVEEKSLLYDDPVKVERKAYEAYQGLKKELADEGVYVELDSCYRSVATQQQVMDEFTEEYGAEYAKRIVATPGYSEHHTGLALDLFLVIDGEQVFENAEMEKHPEVWEKVHAKLADHGFILRYLPRMKLETGYSYEPWHIRYLDDADVAHEIMDAGITYERYLGELDPIIATCEVDYGTSDVYEDSDIDSALDTIMAEFSTWNGCVMNRLAYAGDDACGTDEVEYANSLREDGADEFKQAIVFVTDFHTPDAKQVEGTAWEPDTDYNDYTWHLGRVDAEGGWTLLTWGYA
jgi:D-alanyl-D-alanine carboxypeptidase